MQKNKRWFTWLCLFNGMMKSSRAFSLQKMASSFHPATTMHIFFVCFVLVHIACMYKTQVNGGLRWMWSNANFVTDTHADINFHYFSKKKNFNKYFIVVPDRWQLQIEWNTCVWGRAEVFTCWLKFFLIEYNKLNKLSWNTKICLKKWWNLWRFRLLFWQQHSKKNLLVVHPKFKKGKCY